MKRFVILGAGVAGKRAAERIRKKDPDAEIVVVEEQQDSFYYKPMLGEYLAGKVAEERIVSRDHEPFSNLGARLLTGVRAAALDVAAQEVELESGERIGFDGLLIACGIRSMLPAGAEDGLPGLFSLDNLSQARRMASSLGSANTAVVYGASLSALGAVRGLRERGVACTLLLPEDRFWPGVLDPVASGIVEDRLRQEGISLVKQSGVERFIVKDGRLSGVCTTMGEELSADLFVAAGPGVPAVECLSGTGLASAAGVPVDEALRTGQENIYAAGDVALHTSGLTGGPVAHTGWLSAWEQGAAAGSNMTGGAAVYNGIPALRARALDLDVVCLGLSDADPGTVREESGDYPFEELPYIYKKIVYRDRKVAGALFLGDASEAGRVGQWVRKGVSEDQCDRAVLDQMFQTRILPVQAIGALCPVCKHQMQLDDSCKDGDVMTCPVCGVDFLLERMSNGVFRAGFLPSP